MLRNSDINKDEDESYTINNSVEIKLTNADPELWKSQKYREMLNEFFEMRLIAYASDFDYINQKIQIMANCPAIKKAISTHLDYLSDLSANLKNKSSEDSNQKQTQNFLKNQIKSEAEAELSKKNLIIIPYSTESENFSTKNSSLKSIKLPSEDFISFFETLQNSGVDLWLENSVLDAQSRNNEIDIKTLEKLREFIDIRICLEKGFSLSLQAICLRFVPSHFNSLNCYLSEAFETYSNNFRNLTIAQIRFYWTLIKYFNNCLCAALPIIKPPDTYLSENLLHESEEDHMNLPFPKTMSAFLSSARGIAFSITKQNLIRDIIAYTEFSEEQVQIPSFKFERLNIKNYLDNNVNNKKVGNVIMRKNLQNFNLNFNAFSGIINANNNNNNNFENSIASRSEINRSGNLMINSQINRIFEDETNNNSNLNNLNKLSKQSALEGLSADESLLIQAFEQAKDIDPAFFRSKKMPGDPHVGFKVEFKGELVVGIGGPYRQFFSDISAELQDLDGKHKKLLKLLHPTGNNIAGKGEFKDKFCITPSYNSNTALLYYEFLGLLMGICIRTGVHLTLDLCSLTWKKIVI